MPRLKISPEDIQDEFSEIGIELTDNGIGTILSLFKKYPNELDSFHKLTYAIVTTEEKIPDKPAEQKFLYILGVLHNLGKGSSYNPYTKEGVEDE